MFDRITVIGVGILGVWTIVMIATLVMIANRSATIEAETVATQASQAQPKSAPAAAPARSERVASTPRPTPAGAASSAPASGLTIAFVATSDCWISITRDDGAASERLLKASEKYVVQANEAVAFKAGNAGALSVLINDQPAGPLGREGQVVTRRITRSNYRSFLAS
jgi:cytoskeletal protein RodZ